MALKIAAAALLAAGLLYASPTCAQSVAVEASQTAGFSSEDVTVAATQVRMFGDLASGVRFNLEGAWAVRSGPDTDAFGAAYPYDNRVQVIEAYAERMFRPDGALIVIRGGRYRTPFGIYNASDHAYSGFLRAPLIRYDNYFGLSNNFLENGADIVVGVPRLYVETSVGAPGDVGDARRRAGIDGVIRVQGSTGPVILGISHSSTNPYQPAAFAHGRADFFGVDGRWMQYGIEVRGEWITGQPFDGTRTSGGYVDVLIHRPSLGPVTAVMRAERLDYVAVPPFSLYAHRYTVGARIRVLDRLAVQANVVTQQGLSSGGHVAVDVGLTYVVRRD